MALLMGKKQQAEFTQCLFTIAAICQENRINGRETGEEKKKNTDTIITVNLSGVQSDSERLEQPLLTSFVQAGNINS